MVDLDAKQVDDGVKSTVPHQDFAEEGAPIPSVGDKTGSSGPSVFSKNGAIGSLFEPGGAIGGTAQKIGGPLDKDGLIGSNFKADGPIGGTIQKNLAEKK